MNRKFIHIVGARPNFMKVAPVVRALSGRASQIVVHTGQHYDRNMSDVFFEQLGIPEPDINLEVGSGSHAQQTAQVMMKLEPVIERERPDFVLVYGDVNSTVAATLVCAKLGVRTAHVEAGLRSFDRTMPEEVNRLVTDQLADLLFTPSEDGNRHLLKEGVSPDKIHLVGNVMIDTLIRLLSRAEEAVSSSDLAEWVGQRYALVTLHRPSNVDEPRALAEILDVLAGLSSKISVIFPIHPRTRARISGFERYEAMSGFHLIEPLGYLEFLGLQRHASLVITDSGGVQEETTYLGVPCLTVRENTERPVTVSIGTNILVGRDPARLEREAVKAIRGEAKKGSIPPLWDGRASDRIASVLLGS